MRSVCCLSACFLYEVNADWATETNTQVGQLICANFAAWPQASLRTLGAPSRFIEGFLLSSLVGVKMIGKNAQMA